MTTKTNAIRILEAAKAPFAIHQYDASDGEISAVAVASKIGKHPDCVFKTLVTEGKKSGLNVFVVPSTVELDLKKAASAAQDKYIEMIKSRELEPKTGYIRGGCSPIGMKKQFPTFIDETARLNETITVSGGRIGLQIELSPDDLAKLTNGVFCDLF
jgi:Cys-tRNA(Pro)/Cys-tRNA(Cys) deacylase